VSTSRQGISGLGLEAQRTNIQIYIAINKIELTREFIEIESGKKANRPILNEALAFCKKNKILLLIAKIDRLGRNIAFISSLMESKVKFVAVDYPTADPFILHILAAFAEHERRMISLHTKEALQAAKRRGVKLGKHGKIQGPKNREAADKFAKAIAPTIKRLQKLGFNTITQLTKKLNEEKIPAFRLGSRWHLATVFDLLKRIKKLSKNK
jgi:DNA invertase Pin-like site-specific DNA recombinase